MYMMIVLGVIVLIGLWMIATYNRLVMLRQNVRESWSAIETELRRRYDLIPNLVETVKGYATHEKTTLEEVVRARNSAVNSIGVPDQQSAANTVLSGALTKLVALSEAYPDLKANQNFNELQKEIAETENNLSKARRFYNANVRDMNAAVESFPAVLVAAPLGFKQQIYFGNEDPYALDPVKVNFSTPAVESAPVIKLNTSITEKDKDTV